MRKGAYILSAVLLSLCCFTGVKAQNRYDALRYNLIYPGNDPVNLSMGGSSIASFTGYGSYVENPATVGLVSKNIFSFSIDPRKVRENTTYLNSTNSFYNSQAGIGDLGMIYKIPTSEGSFSIGAGYATLTDFNRAYKAAAFNKNSSIADYFNNSDFYYNLAYNGWAIDSTGAGDTESILRLAKGGFKGINQDGETVESGKMGEVAFFGSVEFLKDFYVGLSLNFPVGYYNYDRTFLEEDSNNQYQTFPYNFSYMNAEDKIHDDITGFYSRLGIVYRASSWLNIGASYQTRSLLILNENYSSSIKTTFDDAQSYPASLNGSVRYKLNNPGRWKIGFSVNPGDQLVINFTGENVDYSSISFQSLGGDPKLRHDENSAITSDFKNVWNIETGVSLVVNSVVPRIGFAYFPSPRKAFDASKTFLSAGLGILLQEGLTLNGGISYGLWKDNVLVYGQGLYYDNSNNQQYSQPVSATEKVTHINTMIGITYRF